MKLRLQFLLSADHRLALAAGGVAPLLVDVGNFRMAVEKTAQLSPHGGEDEREEDDAHHEERNLRHDGNHHADHAEDEKEDRPGEVVSLAPGPASLGGPRLGAHPEQFTLNPEPGPGSLPSRDLSAREDAREPSFRGVETLLRTAARGKAEELRESRASRHGFFPWQRTPSRQRPVVPAGSTLKIILASPVRERGAVNFIPLASSAEDLRQILVGVAPPGSDHELVRNPELLVDGRGAPVSGEQRGSGMVRRCTDQGIVHGASGDPGLACQTEQTRPLSSRQRQRNLSKALRQEGRDDD